MSTTTMTTNTTAKSSLTLLMRKSTELKQHSFADLPTTTADDDAMERNFFLYTNVPSDSLLIYRPDRRLQLWRFVSYALLHANWFHLSFNIIAQLLFGVPLEIMHGAWRVAVIYLAGVFAGSLGTSVVDSAAYLMGASGGVYALLAAQLANIIINYERLRYGLLHLLTFIIFVASELLSACFFKFQQKRTKDNKTDLWLNISYAAHLSGLFMGFAFSLLILKSFGSKNVTKLTWWFALSICVILIIFALAFNLVNTVAVQRLIAGQVNC